MKLTEPLERVLNVFLTDVDASHHGYDLMKAAGVQSGTLYPMLRRLETEGIVVSEWEKVTDDPDGRPPRKYYRLTPRGAQAIRHELAQAAGPRLGLRAVRPAEGH